MGGFLLRGAPVGIGAVVALTPRVAAGDCPGAIITVPGISPIPAINFNAASLPVGFPLPVTILSNGFGGVRLGCDVTDYVSGVGKMVVTQRGMCSLDQRVSVGQQAGAPVVMAINNTSGLLPFEGPIPGVTIPFLGITQLAGQSLRNAAASTSLAATLTNTTIATCGVIPFATFAARAAVVLRRKANDDEFAIGALFTLGAASNGITPLNEPVTLELGTQHWTIPAGSFRQLIQGQNVFGFQGLIGMTSVDVAIAQLPNGSFSFDAAGRGATLTGTVNPVAVGLTIGNDSGSTAVVATIHA